MEGTEIVVRAVRTVGKNTIALELESPAKFDAQPGQFVQVRGEVDGEEITRHYTLSSPDTDGTFEITVGIDPDGDLSPWLAELESGDTIEVDGPFGRSYYEGEESVVVLAGGPGVGPAVGIAERAIADGGEAVVIYRDDEPAHEERLRELETAGAAVVVTAAPLVEDEDVTDALESASGQLFVYGFADFLEEANAVLAATGHEPDDAKSENFG
ncbi:3-phenylpropionate/trans-cinnamate dioxygenase ferredoxin reductase subunit [Haladaptatus litoreus]|uniref:3-phenylpropionate/trans-cinnamate dioxygenase ferredoxin reductase subunit n=1 Tax=Haladaptatus litoreus TaxID=553468 RepID=A0A1N6VE60_9EURY|nr:FAD-dependent oxidoreductase [Haladaptatus litoreus]SIQ76018.1 3-phenylpropionate/trans-cinnamate dioxygenase ferredoxin reductase subunit [Haladaptatus litoreus]